MTKSRKLPESVIIFGCGYVGTALAKHLLDQGVRVAALTRNPFKANHLSKIVAEGGSHFDQAVVEASKVGSAPRVCNASIEVIEGDLDSNDWHERVKGRYEAVVNCVSSAGGGLAGYQKSYVDGQRSILEWAKSQSIRSYVYTSSTSVYPQDDGALVDESADTSAAPATGQLLLESEAMLAKSGILPKWYVLRLAGIYGQGRHFLLNQVSEAKGEIPGSGDYAMNMIHLEDIISALCAALCAEAASDVYNITDDTPTIKADVVAYLAQAMELPTPVFNPEKVSERLKRRGGRMPHRYVSNAKARKALDWSPIFPSYREGYASLLNL
jgi:nucleoside-diphosphate-sugar epimerase